MPKLRNWFHDLHFYFASDDNYCYCLQRLMMPLFGDENWAGLLRGARGDVGGGLPRPLLDRTLTIVLHSFFHIWKIEKKLKKKIQKKKKIASKCHVYIKGIKKHSSSVFQWHNLSFDTHRSSRGEIFETQCHESWGNLRQFASRIFPNFRWLARGLLSPPSFSWWDNSTNFVKL